MPERILPFTAHVDSFARDNLPPLSEWPEMFFALPEFYYPQRCNAGVELLDKAVDLGLTRLRLEAPSSIENTRDFFAEYAAGKISAAEWRCGRYSTVNDDDSPSSRRASRAISVGTRSRNAA